MILCCGDWFCRVRRGSVCFPGDFLWRGPSSCAVSRRGFFSTAAHSSLSSSLLPLHLRVLRKRFFGSPTHPRHWDHLRCLAADAGRPGAQLLGDERSGSLFAGPKRQRKKKSEDDSGQADGESLFLGHEGRCVGWVVLFAVFLFCLYEGIYGFLFGARTDIGQHRQQR
jgi:hypothetical protein